MVQTKEEKKAYRREYYLLNKEKENAYAKKWNLENDVYKKQKEKELRAACKEENYLRVTFWQKENREKYNTVHKKNAALYRNEIAPSYAKDLLKKQGFKAEQITPELIELKRITLKTTRLCRQLKA